MTIRKFSFGAPPADVSGKIDWIIRAIRQIETASNDIDPFQVADGFGLDNVTETRTLDCDMTLVTTDEGLQTLADVVGTLLSDLKKRGSKRRST